ncbi:hypothetical protein OIU91_15180 [Streptomyces sp. NBC_01456]|uniref:hypothetical protein n=1 Tax=unclassified Streptomyces TaxID=2593676 RepID=UPI002E2EE144|nr:MULTISPECIES: hypothetical protein [unclassified Streptomyces]
MVTGLLDVMGAMGAMCAMGAALVTGGADVAHGGGRRGARPGSPVPVRHTSPDGRGRALRPHPAPRPGHGGCARSRERGARA